MEGFDKHSRKGLVQLLGFLREIDGRTSDFVRGSGIEDK